MNDIKRLTELIEKTMNNIEKTEIDIGDISPEYEELGQAIYRCLRQMKEQYMFIQNMANGDFDCEIPGKGNLFVGSSKDLYYKLKHLTWQINEVSKGDYSQHVDFLGRFSDAINNMIKELRIREDKIRVIAKKEALEIEQRNARLQRRMERQLSHYQAYREYVDSFLDFRYKYKIMMGEVYELFSQGKYEEGRRLVAEINDAMGENVMVHKMYSNHEFVNAALMEVADMCIRRNVKANLQVYIPQGLKMNPQHTIEIITAVTEVVIAQINDTEAKEQRLEITSSVKNGWLSVKIIYSCNMRPERSSDDIRINDFRTWSEQLKKTAEAAEIMLDIVKSEHNREIKIIMHISYNE